MHPDERHEDDDRYEIAEYDSYLTMRLRSMHELREVFRRIEQAVDPEAMFRQCVAESKDSSETE